jgi:hypothetical protein
MRLKCPALSVLARGPSLIFPFDTVKTTTSSPTAGFFVVPFMTFPLRSPAEAGKAATSTAKNARPVTR